MPEAFQLKLTLHGISPLIWRRLVVPADTNLADLHQAIQVCMNWTGDFLYVFRLHGKDYSSTDSNANESARKTRLKDLPVRLRERFVYEYNYYCFWQFDIRIEKALLESAKNPGVGSAQRETFREKVYRSVVYIKVALSFQQRIPPDF